MDVIKKIDFEANPIAPTIDDVVEAIHKGYIVASDEVMLALEVAFGKKDVMPVEQFNFGKLTYSAISEAQRESLDFIDAGVFRVPYPECFYRCSIQYADTTVGTSLLVVDGTARDTKYNGVATIMFIRNKDGKHMCAMHSLNMMRVRRDERGLACELQIPQEEYAFWRDTICNALESAPTHQEMCDGSMTMLGLTMIVNTKGVLKERVAPPHKPNVVRALRGKPLLPYVTHVYTDVYMRAVADGPVGTHASPRPHRRRAHVRHYPATDKHAAYVKPIEAMLVNWDGKELAPRKEYEVK